MAPEAASLEVTALSVAYARKPALQSVTLRVGSGECVLLTGNNGAGKTTLIGAIGGRVRPSAGSVRLAGQDVTARPSWWLYRRGVVVVPQERDVFRELTVEENLRLAARLLDRAEWARRRAFVEDVFPVLKARGSQHAALLSGGERRMLAVAISMCAPHLRLLLLDEPSTGLSPAMTSSLVAGLLRLREQLGFSMLVAEQNVGCLLPVADQVLVLRLGELARATQPGERLEAEQIFAYF